MFNNIGILNLLSTQNKPKVNPPDKFLNTSLPTDLLAFMTPQALELQVQTLRKEIIQLLQIKNNLLQEIPKNSLKEDIKSFENIVNQQNPENLSLGSSPKEKEPPKLQKSIRVQIREIVEFLLANISKMKESELEKEKNKYANNETLCELFDILVSKYASTTKTKEELIKLVLRKALKNMKNRYKKQMKMDSKTACSTMATKYFPNSKALLEEKGANLDDEEEFLGILLPFRKNSKNKTMNNTFLGEIFSSDDFCKDYIDFLPDLDDVLREDNEKKVDKFISYLDEIVQKKSLKQISKYRRLPWLALWLDKTKEIAHELLYYAKNDEVKKKLCTDEAKSEDTQGK